MNIITALIITLIGCLAGFITGLKVRDWEWDEKYSTLESEKTRLQEGCSTLESCNLRLRQLLRDRRRK